MQIMCNNGRKADFNASLRLSFENIFDVDFDQSFDILHFE